MVVAETLQHCNESDYDLHLAYDDPDRDNDEVLRANTASTSTAHPIVCQIGGNVPSEAAFATELVHRYGYDRIDLNAECPSDRVTGRREFGAALMKDVDAAVDMVRVMIEIVNDIDKRNSNDDDDVLPVSVKTRIGVDDDDTLEFLLDYIGRLVDAGCRRFVIHARKVYTKGLSPAQNRSVPPLNYQKVYSLCEALPHCDFWLNGGLRSLVDARRVAYGGAVAGFDRNGNAIMRDDVNVNVNGDDDDDDACSNVMHHGTPCEACQQPHGSCIAPSPYLSPSNLRGVMLGRLAMDNPSAFADVDRYFFGEARNPCTTRREVIEKYATWVEQVYPRRCCDDDPAVTLGRSLGNNSIPRVRNCCSVCREYYGKGVENNCIDGTNDRNVCSDALDDSKCTMSQVRHRRHARKCPGARMVSSVIDRPLKPVLGIFFGQPGNARWRREVHRLSRDMTIRNCGPGYILRKSIECISPEILDHEFTKCDGDG